jgi:hypothetical protein
MAANGAAVGAGSRAQELPFGSSETHQEQPPDEISDDEDESFGKTKEELSEVCGKYIRNEI